MTPAREWCGGCVGVALVAAAASAVAGVVLGLVIIRLLTRGRR